MDLGITGKTAIVTGASRGIGRAIAGLLAEEGAHVILSARGREDLETAASEIRAAGGAADSFVTDVSDAETVKALVAHAVELTGTVHILVNNAGGQRTRAGFDQLSDQDFIEAFEDNVLSVVRLTRAVLPYMRANSWGRIVNITSEVSTQPDRVFQHYAAAKAAQLNLSKSLSKTLARDGILVNAVSPGLIMTAGVTDSFARGAKEQGRTIGEVEADFFRKFKPGLVIKRGGTADEVAGVVALLASERASYVTGAEYRVDGGAVVGL
jgi:3-oxoacyl-[acyl-carrier protein] reductase